MEKYLSDSALKTAKIAKIIAKTCKKGSVLLLYGDLGAGKTVFAKGFVSQFSKQNVVSPTFTILNTYIGKININHYDLYRINSLNELDEIGFFETIYSSNISLIEWPERLNGQIKNNVVKVYINKTGEETREIVVERS